MERKIKSSGEENYLFSPYWKYGIGLWTAPLQYT